LTISSGSGNNIAIGNKALHGSTGSSGYNIGIGNAALYNNSGKYNVAIGYFDDITQPPSTTFSYSTSIGYNSQPTGDHQVVLGTSAETIIIASNNSAGPISFPNTPVTMGTKSIQGYMPVTVGVTKYYLPLYI